MITRDGVVRRCCPLCPDERNCVYKVHHGEHTTAECPVILAVLRIRAEIKGRGGLSRQFKRALRAYGYLILRKPSRLNTML